MVITGTLPKLRGALLILPQLLGGMVAAGLVKCMFPGPMRVETTLQNGTSIAQGVFIEMLLTVELVITVLFLAAEKQKSTFIAPVAIGLSLFVAELAGTPGLSVTFYRSGMLISARQEFSSPAVLSTPLDPLGPASRIGISQAITGSTG